MSVKNENAAAGASVVLERPAAGGVYASLFEKINLNPVSELSALDIWQDAQAMSDATADERLTAGMQVFLECLTKSGSKVEKLDKNLIDHHIAELDYRRMPVPAKPLRLPVTAMPRPSGGSRPVRICWLRPVPLEGLCISQFRYCVNCRL